MVSQNSAAIRPIRQPIGAMAALSVPAAAVAAACAAASFSVGIASFQLGDARSEQMNLFLEPFDAQFDRSRIMLVPDAMEPAYTHHTAVLQLLLIVL